MDKNARKRNRRLAAVVVLVVSATIAGYATRDEWTALSDERAVAREAETRRADAEKQVEALAHQRARLESPMGQEEQARRMGYRKPGETPLTVR